MGKPFDAFEIEEVKMINGNREIQKSKRSVIKLLLIFIIFSLSLFVINNLIIIHFFNKSDFKLENFNERTKELKGTIQNLNEQIIEQKVDLNDKIENQISELNRTIDEKMNHLNSEINEQIDEKVNKSEELISKKIDQVNDDLKLNLNEFNSSLIKLINDQETKLNKIENGQKTDLFNTKSELKKEIDEQSNKLKVNIDEQEKINKGIKDEKSELDTKMNDLKDQVDKLLETNKELQQKVIDIDINRSEATFEFVIDNWLELRRNLAESSEKFIYVTSSPFYCRNIPWYLTVGIGKIYIDPRYLSVYLHADNYKDHKNWTINVEFEFDILDQSGSYILISEKPSHKCKLSNENVSCGIEKFEYFNEILDKVIVKVNLKADQLKRIY